MFRDIGCPRRGSVATVQDSIQPAKWGKYQSAIEDSVEQQLLQVKRLRLFLDEQLADVKQAEILLTSFIHHPQAQSICDCQWSISGIRGLGR